MRHPTLKQKKLKIALFLAEEWHEPAQLNFEAFSACCCVRYLLPKHQAN